MALLAIPLAALPGCGRDEPTPEVVVSIPPLGWVARSLAGDGVQVRTLIPPGVSVHGFEPTADDAAAIAGARVVLEVGYGLEGSVGSVINQRAKHATRVRWSDHLDEEESGDDHHDAHDHEGHSHDGHAHGSLDAHLWLDPQLVDILLEPVADAMRDAGLAVDDSRLVATRVDVRTVDAEYHTRLEPFAGRAIVTQHDAWSRLAERYGLRVLRVVVPRGQLEPSADEIAKVAEAIRAREVAGLFTEPQLDSTILARLAEASDVPLGTLDPLGDGDWPQMMRRNLDELVRVLSESEDREANGAESDAEGERG